jgi:hypothetical protein
MATTGPPTSSMALIGRGLGVHAFVDVVLDGFDDDDGVIDHQADGEHQPKSDSVLIEKPSAGKMMKVPMSETGTASSGMSVARQPCRKMKTTMTTRPSASSSVRRSRGYRR